MRHIIALNEKRLAYFNCDFGSYMIMVTILTALLVIPFLSSRFLANPRQSFTRGLSVVFAVFIMAFTVVFPINFKLIFDQTTHENVVDIKKDISNRKTRDRELYVKYNEDRKIYTVSKSEYDEAGIGDIKRMCIRKSALGFEYSTIHD